MEPVLVDPVLRACDVPAIPGPARAEVLLSVDATGAVTAVTPRSEASPYLEVLLLAAPRCTFEPATEDGVPVPVDVPLTWEWPAPPPPPPVEVVPVDVPVDLPPELVEPTEAVGTYAQPPVPTMKHVLGESVLRVLPGTMGDPVRALHALPGVARTPLEAGWLLVRGGDPQDAAAFVDGVRVPLVFHMGGLTSVLDPELVGEVALLPGAFPAAYGGATAGVVDVKGARVDEDLRGAGGVGGVNLAWTHAYVEAPVGPGGLAVAFRRSWLDAVLALAVGQDGSKAAPRFYDATVRYDAGDVGVTALAVSDALDVAEAGGANSATVTQRFAQLQGRIDADVGAGVLAVRPWVGIQDRSITATGRDELERAWFPGLRLSWTAGDATIGFDGEARRYSLQRDGISGEGTLGRADPYVAYSTGDDIRLDVGGRLDTLIVEGQTPRFGPSPRAAVAVRLSPTVELSADGAVLHQAPPELLLVAHPEGRYLPFTTARHTGMALRWHTAPDLTSTDSRADRAVASAVVEVWRRETEDIAAYESDLSLGDLHGRAYGTDLDLTYERGPTHLRAALTLLRSQRREELGDAWQSSRYEQPAFVQLLGARAVGDWTFAARFRAASGFVVPADSDPEAFDILTQTDIDLSPYVGGRAPGFVSADLRAARTWTLRWGSVEAFLDVQNVNSRRIPEPAINGVDESATVYAMGLPVLPIFGVEGRIDPRHDVGGR